MISWPLLKFLEKPHISGTVEARIIKFCLHSEFNVFGKKLIFIPQSGRGLQSRDHFENLEKIQRLLESKRPKQYRPTKVRWALFFVALQIKIIKQQILM